MSDEAGARQYHFDPATYLAMMLAEVPAYRDLQHHVAEAVKGISADSILELGAGTGETSAVVLAVHPDTRLVGIDESQPMLALARCRFPGADLRVQRLEDPLPQGTYDLIFSALTVHHLDGTGKADLFRRVHSRLRRHGRFVLADVVVPDDPEGAVTPVGPPHDKPSTLADQRGTTTLREPVPQALGQRGDNAPGHAERQCAPRQGPAAVTQRAQVWPSGQIQAPVPGEDGAPIGNVRSARLEVRHGV